MVDAQARHGSLAHEAEHETVRRLEDRRILHADRRQLVDVEEAPVVDLVTGGLPERGPVCLARDQFVQLVEASGITLDAVVPMHVLVYERPYRSRLAYEHRQAALHDLLLPLALCEPRGIGL